MVAQPSSSTSTPAAVAGSSAASATSNANEKDASPKPGTKALPVRDRDAFNKMQLQRTVIRDQAEAAAFYKLDEAVILETTHNRAVREDYQKIRTEWRQWFPPSRLYGEGYQGYGNGYTELGAPSRILYPVSKPRPGKRSGQRPHWRRKDVLKQSELHEELVPVRIDVDWDKIKLRDTFTWNLHERLIPADYFASQLVEDMGIKPPAAQPVYDQVTQQIAEQLNDFYPFAYSEEDALDPELPYSAYKNDEMRILVKLNITIGQHTLVDQFEWEINNPSNSPEEFAASMARDLSLSGEFTTAIAHCIREQTQLFTRSLYSVGHPFDGRPVEDPDLVSAFLPSPLPSVFRPQQQAKEYAPYLYELSDADLERNEMIFSREQRRQKRSVNRRGGPQLPDLKERARTIRTLIVSSVLPGAALDAEDSRLKRDAGARKRTGARDGELSESEDSEDSAPDSPAMSALASGTARTRGMRGAASVAQVRMANLGRSETPEASIIHHHETRTAFRRFGRDAREGTEEPSSLIVTLRVSKDKLRRILREGRVKAATTTSGPPTPSGLPNPQRLPSSSSATPVPQPPVVSAIAPSVMGPPSTPSATSKNLPPKAAPAVGPTPGTPATSQQLGWVPAPPPVNGAAPPQTVRLFQLHFPLRSIRL
jgi:SWI/SNF-related matrix-associated actin-dependent regulator of chromatin subfamily B member 1